MLSQDRSLALFQKEVVHYYGWGIKVKEADKSVDKITLQLLFAESRELTISEIAQKTGYSPELVRRSLLSLFGIK